MTDKDISAQGEIWMEATQALSELPAMPETTDTYFDVRRAAIGAVTTTRMQERARALCRPGVCHIHQLDVGYDSKGEQVLQVHGAVDDTDDIAYVRVGMSTSALPDIYCSCFARYHYPEEARKKDTVLLCEHCLVLLRQIQQRIVSENPGDGTDQKAEQLMARLLDGDPLAPGVSVADKAHTVVLLPRVICGQSIQLSFKVGLAGSHTAVISDVEAFLRAVDSDDLYTLGKQLYIDFSRLTFDARSEAWLGFLKRRASETHAVNERLHPGKISMKLRPREQLTGALLDQFYDLACGESCECHFFDGTEGSLQVGHVPVRLQLTGEPLFHDAGGLLFVSVSGTLPQLLQGGDNQYMLTHNSLSRITAEEAHTLRPFLAIADEQRQVQFHVGRTRLPEFYYRVVPLWEENPCIEWTDAGAIQVEAMLPPEPVFTFTLALRGGYHLCQTQVVYLDRSYDLYEPSDASQYRDTFQEQRVQRTVEAFFPNLHASRPEDLPGIWRSEVSNDDALYRLLTAGIPALCRYGTVAADEILNSARLRPVSRLWMNVGIRGHLLELSVGSTDLSAEELQALLISQAQKKPYHRLKNGDFLTLEGEQQLQSLRHILEQLGHSLEEAVQAPLRLSAGCALYLNTLLKSSELFTSFRDHSFNSLVQHFETIQDGNFDLPPEQASLLRPYQQYGYQWLRTLYATGFGGILADDMGLGKTLEIISLVQGLYNEKQLTQPVLVICPASLMYNWQEEFQHFADALSVAVVASRPEMRLSQLKCLRHASISPAVFITSYDLLRRDLEHYRQVRFSLLVLDEAQYVKNAHTAIAQAVRLIPSKHRLALTGTPVENRLSELWSLFDFLMPGFLRTYSDFYNRMEVPIVRHKDKQVAEKLHAMISPFVLRRRKADVLQELPPKTEQIRHVVFGEEQQRLYDAHVIQLQRMLTQDGDERVYQLEILAAIMRIRQICCEPSLVIHPYHGESAKRRACMELIQNGVVNGHRLIVFSQFVSVLKLLESELHAQHIPSYMITGQTPKEQRARLVRRFNTDQTKVFFISLKAGGTGLNLTGADTVIHYDPWWNDASQEQATDRVYRLGQTQQVMVYHLLVRNSIEERIMAMQQEKRLLAEAVLNGESASLATLTREQLLQLIS